MGMIAAQRMTAALLGGSMSTAQLETMLNTWQGHDGERTVIALGREAFFWFGIAQATDVRAALKAFWARGDERYGSKLRINYRLSDTSYPIMLAPLPHPSPANAAWLPFFPKLMDECLLSL